MPELPKDPMSPTQFMEEFVPQALATAEVPADADVQLGVCLEGEGGGEWLIAMTAGQSSVAPGACSEAALTLVQSVDDWRGALWEGRGGEFGRQAAALFGGGPESDSSPPLQLGALSALSALSGLIRIRVTEGEGGDWCTGFKLGPGAIPEEPTTEIEIAADDARAMQEGTLDPMQAFMSGKIRVTGDMALMMQLQAVLMAAAN